MMGMMIEMITRAGRSLRLTHVLLNISGQSEWARMKKTETETQTEPSLGLL